MLIFLLFLVFVFISQIQTLFLLGDVKRSLDCVVV